MSHLFQVKQITATSKVPQRQTENSAGYDIYSDESYILLPGERHTFDTGVAMAIPKGYVGLVMSRSGSAVKNGIEKGAGVIDSDYRGELKVLLYNHSDESYPICRGDRIAQMLIVPVFQEQPIIVEELDSTERGEGGFGSTGKQ